MKSVETYIFEINNHRDMLKSKVALNLVEKIVTKLFKKSNDEIVTSEIIEMIKGDYNYNKWGSWKEAVLIFVSACERLGEDWEFYLKEYFEPQNNISEYAEEYFGQ